MYSMDYLIKSLQLPCEESAIIILLQMWRKLKTEGRWAARGYLADIGEIQSDLKSNSLIPETVLLSTIQTPPNM